MTTRKDIFGILRSFDERDMEPAEFEQHALALIKTEYQTAADFYEAFLARTPVEAFEPTADVDMAEADGLLENVFDFYGEVHDLGPDLNWEHNPGTDHWGHDLNRFTYLRKLVSATRATGDDRYMRKAVALVVNWTRKNDVCDAPEWDGNRERSPYVWRSYLNIALHLGRWTDVIDELAPYMDAMQLLYVMKSIHDQLGWLEMVIPNASNNWVVIGGGGMMETAARLPELKDSDRFIAYAWDRLCEEAEREVLEDGMQFELAQCYHMVVLGRLQRSADICRKAGHAVPAVIDQTLPPMTDYVMHIVTPDGKAVSCNDSDADAGARFKDYLAREGRALGRKDWLHVGTDGEEGALPRETSRAFECGGMYTMRTGWDREAVFLAFDGGPWGKSHQHNDRLSFWLSGYGRSLVVDPGRYLYDRNNPYTPYLKSTFAHSTITVDGAEQADRAFPETWVPGRQLSENVWESRAGFDHAAAEHLLGYGEQGRTRVKHRRGISFWHPDVILVVDGITGEGRHLIESRLQLAPSDLVEDDGVWHTVNEDANLAVIPWMPGDFAVTVEKGQLEPHTSGWYSDGVNRIEASPTLVMSAKTKVPTNAAFLLVPYQGTDLPDMSLTCGKKIAVSVNGATHTVAFKQALSLE